MAFYHNAGPLDVAKLAGSGVIHYRESRGTLEGAHEMVAAYIRACSGTVAEHCALNEEYQLLLTQRWLQGGEDDFGERVIA